MLKNNSFRAVMLAGIALAMTALVSNANEKVIFEKGSYVPYVKSVTTTTGDDGTTNTSTEMDQVFVGKRIIKDGENCRVVETQLQLEKFEASYASEDDVTTEGNDAVASDTKQGPDVMIQLPSASTKVTLLPCK